MSDDVRETNRAHSDALAAVHGQDACYDAEALVAGADSLGVHENAAVGEVAGLDVLHLQYADEGADVAVPTEIVYAHSLGETVTAAIGAGLRVDALHEHLESDFDPRGSVLTPEDDGRLGLRVSGERLPVLFTLLASRG